MPRPSTAGGCCREMAQEESRCSLGAWGAPPGRLGGGRPALWGAGRPHSAPPQTPAPDASGLSSALGLDAVPGFCD